MNEVKVTPTFNIIIIIIKFRICLRGWKYILLK
jgi:hypothetical protein